jgi:hypothetical protein
MGLIYDEHLKQKKEQHAKLKAKLAKIESELPAGALDEKEVTGKPEELDIGAPASDDGADWMAHIQDMNKKK